MPENENKETVEKAVSAPAAKEHPEIAELKARMFDLESRGQGLTLEQKYLVLIATTTCQGFASEAKKFAEAALKNGVKPVAIKEAAMQTIPFTGFKNIEAVLPGVVSVFKEHGVKFPMPSDSTVTDANRIQEGINAQVALFGERVLDWQETIPDDEKGILVNDISGYIFGDFFTRTGLTLKDRELLTFAILVARPDCEPELENHTRANIRLGNTRQAMLGVLQLTLPLIGIPRVLNALKILDRIKEPTWEFYNSISLHL